MKDMVSYFIVENIISGIWQCNYECKNYEVLIFFATLTPILGNLSLASYLISMGRTTTKKSCM